MCPFVLFAIISLFHVRYQIHTLGRKLRITSSPLANTQLDRNYSRDGDLIFERLKKKKKKLSSGMYRLSQMIDSRSLGY